MTSKAAGRKKRAREEAARSAAGTSPPVSPPRPNPNQELKKSKAKTEDLLVLLNIGFLREREVDMWRAAAGDPYHMEKSPDEIPMFTWFAERGLSLPASDFFKGLLGYYDIEYLNLNPNGILHASVFVQLCEAFLGIKPHWVMFRKFFRVKPQPSANNPRVVGVGEFRKTRHPRNVKFNKVLKACFSGAGDLRFSEAWNLRSHEFANVRNSGISIR
jgi:hypothetical protein